MVRACRSWKADSALVQQQKTTRCKRKWPLVNMVRKGSSGGWWEIILICIFDQTTPSTQIEELLKPNHIVFTVGKNYAWFEESTPKSNMSCIQNCHYLGLTNAQKWGQMRIYWNLLIGWKVQQSSLVWIHPQSLYLLDNPFEIYIQFMHTWSNNAVDGWFLLIYFPSGG